ncbi:MAG TPA: DUF2914 domain-containing protein [Rhizomicrobium sp.]
MRPIQSAISLAHRYERHISAVSLVGGFAFDNYAFGRIDRPSTHMVFIGYLLVAAITIAVLHRLESRPAEKQPSARTRTILTAVTQFALGCLLSGFCVFYLRSASLFASWPYLLILASIFIGNEVFRRYHSRLALSALLLFFALISYTILLVPVLLAMIGTIPFLVSSALAVVIFLFYLRLLAGLGRERFRSVRHWIMLGMIVITAAINFFYFTKVLPPLPLALADAGIYHSEDHVGSQFEVIGEPQSWTVHIGRRTVMHAKLGDTLYALSAVFAPARLSTRIIHDWQWYDPVARKWRVEARPSYSINGGRDGGYRYFSKKTITNDGDWRVDIETPDGRRLGRIRFRVVPPKGPVTPVLETIK